MLCNWLFSFCTICLLILVNDFITLMFGEKYVLDIFTTFIIGINFYMAGSLNPIWIYRDTTGLFTQRKWMPTNLF